MAKCCMCDKNIEREDAPVLSMGAAGIPRLLCDDCATLLDTATLGRDFDEIKSSVEEISKIMADNDPDGVTYSIVSELMMSASERAKAIKDGTYDFSLDESEDDEDTLDDIPEEMLESEEDKAEDKKDEEKLKKFDKFYNVAIIIIGAISLLVLVWRLAEIFFLK